MAHEETYEIYQTIVIKKKKKKRSRNNLPTLYCRAQYQVSEGVVRDGSSWAVPPVQPVKSTMATLNLIAKPNRGVTEVGGAGGQERPLGKT